MDSFKVINPYPFGKHYCMRPVNFISIPTWKEDPAAKECFFSCGSKGGSCPDKCSDSKNTVDGDEIDGYCCSKNSQDSGNCPMPEVIIGWK